MDNNPNKRVDTFLFIILFIQILILIAMFLVIQQVNKAVVEIKKFCWGDKILDTITNPQQPSLNIIQ
jgi:hypothetical protein